MTVNNSSLIWPMNEGNIDGVDLWYWIKVIYESAAKLDPLRRFYGEKIRLLKLKSGGSLGDYIKRFQGLEILWREINMNVQPEYRIVTQILEQIEDPLFYGPCESINNWYQTKCTFRDATATLRAHEISKMTAQTKKAIENEVNSLILGSSNKNRAIGEHKTLRALRLGDHKDAKKPEYRIPLKVWKMMTPEARTAMRSGKEVNIGLVKDSAAKTFKHGGRKISQHHKKNCAKFLRLTQAEENKNDASYMKSVEEFIADCGGPS